jgi:hypothetical protein
LAQHRRDLLVRQFLLGRLEQHRETVAAGREEDRDLNSPKELFDGMAEIKTDPEMVQLATQLVQRQAGEYDSADLEDRYETRLRALIGARHICFLNPFALELRVAQPAMSWTSWRR